MTYVEHGEFGEDRAELLLKGILRELDFAHVEVTDATYLEVFVNDLRKVIVKTGTTIGERTVGVFRWVFERTMSKKSAAVGTGAIALRPLVDIVTKRAHVPHARDQNFQVCL
jgi:hypothetical protein